jgi:WD40 repeat protein
MDALSGIRASSATYSRLVFSQDGKLAAARGSRDTVRILELASLREVKSIAVRQIPLQFSTDGNALLTFDHINFQLNWHKASNQTETIALENPPSSLREHAFSSSRGILATGDDERMIHLWESSSGRKIAQISGHPHSVEAMEFSPDGKLLVTVPGGPGPRSLYFWDVSRQQLLGSVMARKAHIGRLCFSPDGSLVASTSDDNNVNLWRTASRELVGDLNGHRQTVMDVAFSPDGRLLATGSTDGTIKLWNVSLQQELATLRYDETGSKDVDDRVWLVEFSPDGSTLAAIGRGDRLRVWRAPTFAEIESSGARP